MTQTLADRQQSYTESMSSPNVANQVNETSKAGSKLALAIPKSMVNFFIVMAGVFLATAACYFLVSFFTNKVDAEDDLLEEKEEDQQKTNWWMTAIGVLSAIALGSAIAYQFFMAPPRFYLLAFNEDGLMSVVYQFHTVKELNAKCDGLSKTHLNYYKNGEYDAARGSDQHGQKKIVQCCRDRTGAIYILANDEIEEVDDQLSINTCTQPENNKISTCSDNIVTMVQMRAKLSEMVKDRKQDMCTRAQDSTEANILIDSTQLNRGQFGLKCEEKSTTLLDIYKSIGVDYVIFKKEEKTAPDQKAVVFKVLYAAPILTDALPRFRKNKQPARIAVKAYEYILKQANDPIVFSK